jgi:hypothetical protein
MGDAEAGVSLCARAVALSPDPVNSAWALGFIGFAHREAGDLERAIDELGRSIAAVRTARHPRVLCWFEGWLADALTWAGRTADGRRSARSAIASARRVGCPWAEAYAERALGRVALAEGRAGPAERRLARARARYEGLEARFEAGVTALDQVAGAEAAGDGRAARAFAEEARVLLEPLPVPRWHERLRARSPSAPGPASAAGAEGGRG